MLNHHMAIEGVQLMSGLHGPLHQLRFSDQAYDHASGAIYDIRVGYEHH